MEYLRKYNEVTKPMKIFRSISVLLICAFTFAPSFAFAAAPFSANPLVIDGKGKAREILKYNIMITNTSKQLVSLYPWVTNYTSASGTQVMPDLAHADLSTSLANWIEVTRGVIDLAPGESRDVPVLIQVSLDAKPGTYHAAVAFAHGFNRIEAEANLSGTIAVPVNIEVLDDANEKLQLGTFRPKKNWFMTDDADFEFAIENIGNRGLVPQGKIRIYDRRGAEVATVEANTSMERLEPSKNALLSSVWHAGGHFGRYKAMLDLEYGASHRGTLQDTVFFWVVPWHKIVGMFLTLAIIGVIVAIMIRSRSRAMPSYAVAYVHEDEPLMEEEMMSEADGDVDVLRESLMTRIKRSISGKIESFRSAREMSSGITPKRHVEDSLMAYSEEPVVNAPTALSRLGASRATSLSSAGTSEHTVRLTAPVRPTPPPEHIVNLKR